MISYTEQAVNGVPNVLCFLFLSFFLFKVNKGVNQFQLFMCLGIFIFLVSMGGLGFHMFGLGHFSSRLL